MASTHVFGNDRPLLYDVEPWNLLGFAVPNFGENVGTLSQSIWGLADQVAKTQLTVMTHVDAQRTQYPSINTVMRIAKMCNRIRDVLISRLKKPADMRIEEVHATADLKPWQMHPVPYFRSAIVRNHWLSEYNGLVMIALTNMYQHSDNNLMLTVTIDFAAHVMQYFNEIKRFVGVELLGVDPEAIKSEGFTFTEEHYQNYNTIRDRSMNFEALDKPGPLQARITEDDLQPFFEGIPAPLILPNLRQYGVGENSIGWQGGPLDDRSAAPGTADGSAVAPAGGTIGEPMI